MKSINVTPNSSEKSSTTTMDSSDTSQSENIDDDNNNNRCYLPKCKRDTNCNCEMCLASINATLDLISHTKLSSSIKPPRRSPVKFHPLSTPRPTHRRRASVSPTPGTNKRNTGFGFFLVVVVVVLGLILGAEYGLSLAVSRVLKPKLSPEIVRNLGRKSWVFQDLIKRVTYLNTEVNGLVGTKVSNRSSVDSMCQIIQDGLLLHSRCTLYKSASEELSIWGWPLQTAGLLTAEISSRSFTILSGRVTEWSNGELTFSIREANSSWTQGKWSSSIVQFDRNTWIIEYKRSFLIEISRFFSAGLEFLKFQTKRKFQNVKKGFWMSSAFDYLYNDNRESSFTIPT